MHGDLNTGLVQGQRGAGDFPQRLVTAGGNGQRVDVQDRVVPPVVLHQGRSGEAGGAVVDGRDDAELRMLGEGDIGLAERAPVAGRRCVGCQGGIERGVDLVAGLAQQLDCSARTAGSVTFPIGQRVQRRLVRNGVEIEPFQHPCAGREVLRVRGDDAVGGVVAEGEIGQHVVVAGHDGAIRGGLGCRG
ncbi:hypothetical protein PV356_35805, partial [Streptomyces sp. WI03-5b]|uniref:hypothetical protein n=1 Tax=Streptomyces sp. WI03-5b TaxID=462946 RepID=UPI0029B762C1